jgi:hypothetical protein
VQAAARPRFQGMAHAGATFECFEIARGSSFAVADAMERAWGGGNVGLPTSLGLAK